MVVAQCPVGVHGDLGAEQVCGSALELEHVEQVAVIGDVAAEPAEGGKRQVGDPVPGGQLDQFGGVRADLLLGGGRLVRRLGESLAYTVSLPDTAWPGLKLWRPWMLAGRFGSHVVMRVSHWSSWGNMCSKAGSDAGGGLREIILRGTLEGRMVLASVSLSRAQLS
jgi:hypothetical protein